MKDLTENCIQCISALILIYVNSTKYKTRILKNVLYKSYFSFLVVDTFVQSNIFQKQALESSKTHLFNGLLIVFPCFAFLDHKKIKSMEGSTCFVKCPVPEV